MATTPNTEGVIMGKVYFYAGYGFSLADGGLHHRSDQEAGAAAHAAYDNVKHGDRVRFVVRVEGSYFPARANERRGTLATFLANNELTGAAGHAVPTWLVDAQVIERFRRVQAEQVSEAPVVASEAPESVEAIDTHEAPAALTAAEWAEVADADGAAALVESGEATESTESVTTPDSDNNDEEVETPNERKNRLRRERRANLAKAHSAKTGQPLDLNEVFAPVN
jgi:hypothetical protein